MPHNSRSSACERGEGLDRRQLIQASLMLAGVPPLCCTAPEVSHESVSYQGARLILDLNKASDLRPVGSARAVVDIARKLNIIVAHIERRRFVALDRSCTHGGAQCAYNHKRRTLQCTSLNHAEYDLNGTLLHGRTHGNLRSYEVRLAGTRLEISLEKKA
jgi:nitrite reductase/ring-hydroxylating ferredoxin subunit